MEDIYPEIALKQPKADPRTVLLNKRNFIESSSDHIQDYYRNSLNNTTTTTTETTTANCDKSKNIIKNNTDTTKTTTTTTTNAQKCSKISFKSQSASSISSTSSLSALSSSSSSLLSSTVPLSSSSSSSLLSTILVKFSKSCHFNASFNNNTNYLYKTQKTTKLIFFLLFIWCAILIQTTQALPARRVATSGRKLILHTNVYRERYHQKLLEEQRQHNLQQQQIQLQLLEEQQLQQRQRHQTLPHPPSIHHHQLQVQQQNTAQQPQQVQKNHIFSPGPALRRHPQPQLHHRHHLHQRAAPPSHRKMSVCTGSMTKIYDQLHTQMNTSMSYIKKLCANYLRGRGNETFESMSDTWKLISLETRNPNRKTITVENKLHKEIVEFYLNLHNFDQLIDYASQDTTDNKTKIEHGEEIEIDNIIKFFETVKNEIKFNMMETNAVLDVLQIEKPDLADNKVEFNSNIGRRIRDFLIMKNLIEEFERVLQLVQNYCENNRSE